MRDRLRVGRVGKGMGHSGRYKGTVCTLRPYAVEGIHLMECGMHVCLLRVCCVCVSACLRVCVWAGGGAHVTAVFNLM